MKIYCINLDQNPERLAHMQQQLDGLGLEFERFAAVNGLEASKIHQRPVLPDVGHPATPGEFGCLLSHRAIWQLIFDGDEPHALILEDDVFLSARLAEFIQVFDAARDAIPQFDLVKLDSSGAKILVEAPVICLANCNLQALHSSHFGAAAYILSKPGSAKLLRKSADLRMVADEIFEKYVMAQYKLRVYQADPALAAQREYHASLTASRQFDSAIDAMGDRHARARARGLRKFMREIRRLWIRLRYRFVWRFPFNSKDLVESRVDFCL